MYKMIHYSFLALWNMFRRIFFVKCPFLLCHLHLRIAAFILPVLIFPPPHGSLKWHYWTYRSLNCLCRSWMTKHTHYFNSRAPDQNNRIFAINIMTRWVVCSDVCGRTRVQCFPGFLLQISGPSAVCEACLLAQLTFIIFPCRWKPGLPVPTETANIGIELC